MNILEIRNIKVRKLSRQSAKTTQLSGSTRIYERKKNEWEEILDAGFWKWIRIMNKCIEQTFKGICKRSFLLISTHSVFELTMVLGEVSDKPVR